METYEPGDVNALDDAGYEPGDVNAMATDEEPLPDELGNRAVGGMPASVLRYVARSLADDPESVVVEADQRQGAVTLRLHVAQGDMGRVIGRRGRTAQAIRTLIGVAGARDGVRTNVDIVDD
jgi:predicted RNA-binding protein YlqC (UPF0109 family)